MWNPFKKPPHTRKGYEEADIKAHEAWGKTIALGRDWEKYFLQPEPKRPPSPAFKELYRAKVKRKKLKDRGHKEALELENKYQKLLEELEKARKAKQSDEEIIKKEEAVREFEEKELGMKPKRPLHSEGPYR